VEFARFLPDGRALLVSGGGIVQRWNAEAGRPEGAARRFAAEGVKRFYSSDATKVLAIGLDPGCCRLLDAVTEEPVGNPFPVPGGQLYLSPDGRFVVNSFGGSDASPVRDARTGTPLGPTPERDWHVIGAAFSPDGRRALTVTQRRGNDRDLNEGQLWDLERGAALGAPFQLQHYHQEDLACLALSPGHTTALAVSRPRGGGDYRVARLWDVSRGPASHPVSDPLKPGRGGMRAAAFDPAGRWLVTVSDGEANLWNTAAEGAPGPVVKHADVLGAAFQPGDGRTFVTWGPGVTRRWETRSGKPADVPLAGSDPAFSLDGRFLVTRLAQGVHFWPLDLPLELRKEGVELWARLMSAHELTEKGDVREVPPEAWRKDRARFEQVIGWSPGPDEK
jgi:hypothetical protein